MQQTWSIIIFAYNEENGIRSVIRNVTEVLNKITSKKFEIIIVDDGSTDKTKEIIVEEMILNKNIHLIQHENNKGIGKSLMSGYANARYENVCAIPADGQFDVCELLPFAYVPEKTIISFYRIEKTRYSLYRKILSFGNKFFNKYFLGIKIKDVNWIKIYKKIFFDEIKPVLSSSLVESEICAKMIQNKYHVIEVESKYNNRIGGVSKGASFKVLVMAIVEISKLFWVIKVIGYKKNNKNV